MADSFSVSVNPSLDEPSASLDAFARALVDLSSFWPGLAESLADESQARWPLRRRTGRLRESLRWAGTRLGEEGIYKPTRDALVFGTSTFYSAFHHLGVGRLRKRELLHVDTDDTTKRLEAWASSRATAAGLEVL